MSEINSESPAPSGTDPAASVTTIAIDHTQKRWLAEVDRFDARIIVAKRFAVLLFVVAATFCLFTFGLGWMAALHVNGWDYGPMIWMGIVSVILFGISGCGCLAWVEDAEKQAKTKRNSAYHNCPTCGNPPKRESYY